jgi:CubicO group peptidase (beta-lactamase class C family)
VHRLTTTLTLLFCLNQIFGQQQQVQALINQYGVPGIQLVCIKSDKEEILNLGTISKESNSKVTDSTIFEAASLSKCVFAYAVLRLYDRGVLSLDTPLIHYIGSYERFDSTDPRYNRITARMVLRHSTGLPNWGDDKYARLIFTPDSMFSYSGEGFQYLQRVVEKLTGKTLNQVAQEEVFTPLGMKNSNYGWNDKFGSRAAFGDSAVAINNHKYQKAAASLLSCAHDYALFLRAIMMGKGLKPQTWQMMMSKQSAGIWFNHRITPANEFIGWGLGMGLQENEQGKWLWQWGDNGDFKGLCVVNSGKKEALVYFTHSNWGLHIASDVLSAYFPPQTWWINSWLEYQFFEKKNVELFWTRMDKEGYDHASAIAMDLKRKDTAFTIPQTDLNDLGFIMIGRNKKKEAVEIFKYDVEAYPNDGDAYNGLAQAYEENGDKQLAINNYKKSVELNPQNNFAADRIKQLGAETK